MGFNFQLCCHATHCSTTLFIQWDLTFIQLCCLGTDCSTTLLGFRKFYNFNVVFCRRDFTAIANEGVIEANGRDVTGGPSLKQTVKGGFQFVGRLSTAILKILIQLPGIKMRVFTEILEAQSPLKLAISDLIGENAEDMLTLFQKSTEIIRDATRIMRKLVSDVLALKGRMISKLGGDVFNTGSSLFDGTLRIAGAAVQSGSDTASAIGRGVSDTITVVNEAGLPEKPSLQNLGGFFGKGRGEGVSNGGGFKSLLGLGGR